MNEKYPIWTDMVFAESLGSYLSCSPVHTLFSVVLPFKPSYIDVRRRHSSPCVIQLLFVILFLFGLCLCAMMPWFYFCFFTLLSKALAHSAESLISCYGFGNWEYRNNTACPGLNACCGSEATCTSNRLCHNPEDGSETSGRISCQNIYDQRTQM